VEIDKAKHATIRAALIECGSGISALARELSVAPSTVTVVSQGYRRSKRIEAAIAHKLGKEPFEIWPERYEGECNEITDL